MATSAAPAYLGERFAQAYAAVRADRSLQFTFPPPDIARTPAWVDAMVRFGREIAPMARVAVWCALALITVALVSLCVRALLKRRGRVRAPREALTLGAEQWRPQTQEARILLEEADRLAAEGLHAEAVHVLLLRSVQDIQRWRPGLIRPAFTSREIATLEALPQAGRRAFAVMADAVERSLFAGVGIDAEGFCVCRRTYESFALDGAAPLSDRSA